MNPLGVPHGDPEDLCPEHYKEQRLGNSRYVMAVIQDILSRDCSDFSNDTSTPYTLLVTAPLKRGCDVRPGSLM